MPSIDLDDTTHAQTTLAYDLNGKPLLVATARRCGCAWSASSATSTPSTFQASNFVDSFTAIRGAKGGCWEVPAAK